MGCLHYIDAKANRKHFFKYFLSIGGSFQRNFDFIPSIGQSQNEGKHRVNTLQELWQGFVIMLLVNQVWLPYFEQLNIYEHFNNNFIFFLTPTASHISWAMFCGQNLKASLSGQQGKGKLLLETMMSSRKSRLARQSSVLKGNWFRKLSPQWKYDLFTFSLTWAFRFPIRNVIRLNIIVSLFVFAWEISRKLVSFSASDLITSTQETQSCRSHSVIPCDDSFEIQELKKIYQK